MLFRYPGGKDRITKPILAYVSAVYAANGCTSYSEPFFGGGAVCFKLLQSGVNVEKVWINDLDPGIFAIWWAVINEPSKLKKKIAKFEPSVDHYYAYKKELKSVSVEKDTDLVDLALKKIALHQMSYSGLGTKSGGPIGGAHQRGKTYKIDCRWSPDNMYAGISLAGRLLKGKTAMVTMEDYKKALASADAKTCVYLDPPYFEKGSQLYQYAFGEKQHEELRDLLRGSKFPWVLSYDNHPEIRKLYEDFCVIKEVPISYTINGGVKNSELLIVDRRWLPREAATLD